MKPTADGMSDYLEANAEKLLSNRWDKRLKASMTILQERSIIQPLKVSKKVDTTTLWYYLYLMLAYADKY